MKYLAALLLLAPACATRGSVERVHARIDAVDSAIDRAVSLFEQGEMDGHGALAQVQAEARLARVQSEEAEREAKRAAAERGWSILQTLLTAGLSLFLGVPASVAATNRVRDGWRRKRGEPVSHPTRVVKAAPAPKMGAE